MGENLNCQDNLSILYIFRVMSTVVFKVTWSSRFPDDYVITFVGPVQGDQVILNSDVLPLVQVSSNQHVIFEFWTTLDNNNLSHPSFRKRAGPVSEKTRKSTATQPKIPASGRDSMRISHLEMIILALRLAELYFGLGHGLLLPYRFSSFTAGF